MQSSEEKSEQQQKATYILENTPDFLNSLVLRPRTLSKISLGDRDLGKSGLEEVLLFLQNGKKLSGVNAYQNVTNIVLRNTKIDYYCLSLLKDILDILTECVSLDVSDNDLGEAGVREILTIALKTKIQHLALCRVQPTNLNILAVVKLVSDNNRLSTIDFSSNNLSSAESMLLLEQISKLPREINFLVGGLNFGPKLLKPLFSQTDKRKSFFFEDDKKPKKQKKMVDDLPKNDNLIIQSFNLITPSRLNTIYNTVIKQFEEYDDKKNYDIDISDSRMRPDGRLFSFSNNFPRFSFDARFLSFPIVQFPDGYFLSQGPDPGKEKFESGKVPNTSSVIRFLNELCLNNKIQTVDTVLIIGNPNDGEKYYDYFSANGTRNYGAFTIKSEEGIQEFPYVRKFDLVISRESEPKVIKKLTVYQASCCSTNKKIELSDPDKIFFYKLCLDKNPKSLLVHCDTGLSFSPAILLSFYLFRNFTTIFSGDNESIVKRINGVIAEIRKLNSLLIPYKELLASSFQLAYSYMESHCEGNTSRIHAELPIKTVCVVGSLESEDKTYQFIQSRLNSFGITLYSLNVDLNQKFAEEINQAIQVNGDKTAFYIRDLIATSVIMKIRMLHSLNKLHGVIFLSKNLNEELMLEILKELPRDLLQVYVSSGKFPLQNITALTLNYPSKDLGVHAELMVLNKAITSIYANLTYPMESTIAESVNVTPPNKSIVVSAPAYCYDIDLLSSLDRCWHTLKYPMRKFLSTETATQKEIAYLIDQQEVQCVIEFPTLEIINNKFQLKTYSFEGSEKSSHYIIIPAGINCLKLNNDVYDKKEVPLGKEDTEHSLLISTVEEVISIGEGIAFRANSLGKFHKVDILLPKNGLSNYEGLNIDASLLFTTIKQHINEELVNLEFLDAHINADDCILKIIEKAKYQNADNNNLINFGIQIM